MEVKTYRARSLQQALQWIRNDLGPEAAVLHTREVRSGLFGWGGRQLEVVAGVGVHVPSRFAEETASETEEIESDAADLDSDDFDSVGFDSYDFAGSHDRDEMPAAHIENFREKFRRDLMDHMEDAPSMVEELCRTPNADRAKSATPEIVSLFTELMDAEFDEETARELIQSVRVRCSGEDARDPLVLKARMARLIEEQIPCRGPICVAPNQRRIVAVVGPTGVGKTTTIAKLAAHFHLRGHRRVGLVTVDTYRVAAVDQLRTYADIIDLPMEVVSTPREMRAALARLADMELVLLDTAGRSPSDDLKIQELKSMLNEARADDVQLVVSAVGNASCLRMTAERFASVGVNGLLLTKVDEATALGHLVPLLRACRLPLTYVTNGQDVPDDIAPAESRKLARMILRLERGQ